MFCKQCGNQIDDNSKFCEKCGTSIEGVKDSRVEINVDDNNVILSIKSTFKLLPNSLGIILALIVFFIPIYVVLMVLVNIETAIRSDVYITYSYGNSMGFYNGSEKIPI